LYQDFYGIASHLFALRFNPVFFVLQNPNRINKGG
jgi:hypothetical protein